MMVIGIMMGMVLGNLMQKMVKEIMVNLERKKVKMEK